MTTGQDETDQFDYRSWVGPPENYDLMSGLQFGVLFALGLREHHRVIDVGCGSLRAGRLLIPYLQADRYFGIEPSRRFVDEGIAAELGASVVEVKRPRFSYRDDFVLTDFGETFDFALAQSIFSHTHPGLLTQALDHIAEVLGDRGLLVGTYVSADESTFSNVVDPVPFGGWEYPGAVRYTWHAFEQHLRAAGLSAVEVSWRHPYQRWFVASRGDAHQGAEKQLRRAFFNDRSRDRRLVARARAFAGRAKRRISR